MFRVQTLTAPVPLTRIRMARTLLGRPLSVGVQDLVGAAPPAGWWSGAGMSGSTASSPG